MKINAKIKCKKFRAFARKCGLKVKKAWAASKTVWTRTKNWFSKWHMPNWITRSWNWTMYHIRAVCLILLMLGLAWVSLLVHQENVRREAVQTQRSMQNGAPMPPPQFPTTIRPSAPEPAEKTINGTMDPPIEPLRDRDGRVVSVSPKPSDAPSSVIANNSGFNNPPQIAIDLDKQELAWLSMDGRPNRVFKISSGKPGTPTPNSLPSQPFRIQKKQRNHELAEVKLETGKSVLVPYWMTLIADRGIAIHGVKNPWGLVYPGSAACIRMNEADAAWLYENVTEGPQGTQVTIVGSEKTYITQTPDGVFPWQREGEKELVEQRPDGGYQFKRPISPEMRVIYRSLIDSRRLGIYNPTPKQIAADGRWAKTKFVNFPNVEELGSLSKQTFDQCRSRYITMDELQASLGGFPVMKR